MSTNSKMSNSLIVGSHSESPQWVPSKRRILYDDDQLIDAYQIGKQKGREELIEEVRNLNKTYVKDIQTVLSQLFHELYEKGIAPLGLALRASQPLFYEATYVLDKEIYFSDQMDYVYGRIMKIESELNKRKDFELRIFLVPLIASEEDLNENLATFDWFYGDPS